MKILQSQDIQELAKIARVQQRFLGFNTYRHHSIFIFKGCIMFKRTLLVSGFALLASCSAPSVSTPQLPSGPSQADLSKISSNAKSAFSSASRSSGLSGVLNNDTAAHVKVTFNADSTVMTIKSFDSTQTVTASYQNDAGTLIKYAAYQSAYATGALPLVLSAGFTVDLLLPTLHYTQDMTARYDLTAGTAGERVSGVRFTGSSKSVSLPDSFTTTTKDFLYAAHPMHQADYPTDTCRGTVEYFGGLFYFAYAMRTVDVMAIVDTTASTDTTVLAACDLYFNPGTVAATKVGSIKTRKDHTVTLFDMNGNAVK